MNEKREEQQMEPEQKPLRHLIGRFVMWIGIAIVLFVFVIGMYISLAAYVGQSNPVTEYGSLLAPAVVTGIVLVLFGVAALLYPSGPSQDGSWVVMMGPYVR